MTKSIYVGNLPWSATEDELLNSFSDFGAVSARITTDRETGRSRGFGFVEVPEEQLQAAIDAMNGAEWDGRQLTVNEARPREPRQSRSGGGGGRRY